MGCFPPCFAHWNRKRTIKRVQHQTLISREELLQEAAIMLGASWECHIDEEDIASVIKHVSQSHAEPEEEMKGCCQGKESNGSNVEDAGVVDNEGNGGVENKREKSEEDDPLTPDPAANNAHEDFLAIDKEYALAATPVASEEKITLEYDNVIRDSSCPIQMESSESLFSLSIDSRKHVSAAEKGDKEVSSALKLLENTSSEEKENVNVNLEGKWSVPSGNEALVKQSGSKLNYEVIAMDTSLSNWLAGSEKACDTSNESSPESEKNYGGRPILGLMRPEPSELKQLKGGLT